jgi:hypothetical protein
MNKRALLFSVFLAFGATLSFVPRAAADHDHRNCDRGDYRGAYGRDDYRGSYGRVGGNDRCSAGAAVRINKDRAMIRRWEGTGRHQKVVQWARQDLANVQRDLANCRGQARNGYYDRDVDYNPYDSRPVYDPSYDRDPYSGNDDPYYGSDRGFDFKRDWPLALGAVLGAQIGR